MNPGSRQILYWFVGVVVSCANRGVLNHLVVDGHRLPLQSWPWRLFSFTFGNVGVHGMADPGYSNCGVMSSATVAVVFGAAELGCLGQHEEHLRLVFHFWERAVRSRISWKRCVDDVLVGSRVFCRSCIFVFVRACYQIPISLVSGASTAVHTWVDVLRVVGQHVAVNIKNPNRSWVHDRGPQQKSTFLPWTGVLEGGNGFHSWALCWVIWQEPGCWGYQNSLGWLVSWKMLWNWCMGYPLSVIRGLVHTLPCSRVAHVGRKRGFLIARSERCLTLKRITSRNLGTVAAGLIVIGRVAVESQGIVAQLGGKSTSVSSSPFSEETWRKNGASESGPEVFEKSLIHDTSSGKRRRRGRRERSSCKSRRRCLSRS